MKKIIIDLQDRIDYNYSHYPGSINIPYNDLINNYRTYLNRENIYYLYCRTGHQSRRASTMLNYLGYNTLVIDK